MTVCDLNQQQGDYIGSTIACDISAAMFDRRDYHSRLPNDEKRLRLHGERCCDGVAHLSLNKNEKKKKMEVDREL